MNSKKQNFEKPCCYAILTADVRYDTRLSSTAKLLYAEISALSSKTGYCFATNGYFAWLYDISERQVTKIIKSLSEFGYIAIEYKNNMRRIFISEGTKKSSEGMKKSSVGGEEKFLSRGEKKFSHNNINNNNKYNNYYNKPDVFEDYFDHEALEKAVWEKLGKR